MNYDPRWGYGGPPPYSMYPPQSEVRYIPIPTNSKDDAISFLKKELKELKREKKEKKPDEPKKKEEEKKKPTLTYLECAAWVLMSGPFVMLIYGGIIFTTAKVLKSLI